MSKLDLSRLGVTLRSLSALSLLAEARMNLQTNRLGFNNIEKLLRMIASVLKLKGIEAAFRRFRERCGRPLKRTLNFRGMHDRSWLSMVHLILGLAPCSLLAAEEWPFLYENIDGRITITGYRCSGESDISIPATMSGFPVTTLGSRAFANCGSITNVSIPDTVTSIGREAFSYCTNLISVVVPANLTSLADGAFMSCSRLSGFHMPNTLVSIGRSAFADCVKLTNIFIPIGVTNVGFQAFTRCKSLQAIEVDPQNPSYRSFDGALLDGAASTILVCPAGKPGSFSIPFGVVRTLASAFSHCAFLRTVEFPDTIIEIGSGSFYGCSNLTSVVLPQNLTALGDETFAGCSNLGSISIPDKVAAIGRRAFYDCSNLSDVTIGKSVSSIGAFAFEYCTQLRSLLIPENVTAIYWSAFRQSGLAEIGIPDSVITMETAAFQECRSLERVTLGRGLRNIPQLAFDGCAALKTATIASGAAYIAPSAFQGCSNLASIDIPDTVGRVYDSAFRNCTALGSARLSRAMTNVEPWTFSGCSSLTNIVIPDGVRSIGNGAFYGCSNLSTIAIPESVTSIAGAFSRSGLTSLVIPNSVTNLGDSAFASCSRLTNVIMGISLTKLGIGAFFDCVSLIRVSFAGQNLTNIPNECFRGCIDLREIELPESIAAIGNSAFQNCRGLANLSLPKNLTTIGGHAFSGCASLTTLAMGPALTNLNSLRFAGCASLTSITADSMNPLYRSIDGVLFNKAGTTLVVFPPGRRAEYAIPEGVTQLAGGAFLDATEVRVISIPSTLISTLQVNGSAELVAINVDPSNPNFMSLDGVLFNREGTMLLRYPSGKAGSYTIPPNCSYIWNLAFSGCQRLASVDLNNVRSIGDGAFESCTSITTVSLKNVLSIGGNAFADCTSLMNILFPDQLRTLGKAAFKDCESLSGTVKIPWGIDKIDYYTFEGCKNISGIIIPDTVLEIQGSAFAQCKNLREIIVPDSVRAILVSAFADCTALSKVTLGKGVATIGKDVFKQCFSLESITVDPLNSAYSSMDGVLFNKDGSSLVQYPPHRIGPYMVPPTVKIIEERAFFGCAGLTSVFVGEHVQRIHDYAFSECSNLAEVVLQTAFVGAFAFYNCPRLIRATFGPKTIWIAKWAFYGCGALTEMYFEGGPPIAEDLGDNYMSFSIYYPLGTPGWSGSILSRPTTVWLPRMTSPRFEETSEGRSFGFTVSWASGQIVLVEAASSVAGLVWTPLSTNRIENGSTYFVDLEPSGSNQFFRARPAVVILHELQ